MSVRRAHEQGRVLFKKESPDVETPGLLVKALISSFFIGKVYNNTRKFQNTCCTNIAGKKHTNKRSVYYFVSIL